MQEIPPALRRIMKRERLCLHLLLDFLTGVRTPVLIVCDSAPEALAIRRRIEQMITSLPPDLKALWRRKKDLLRFRAPPPPPAMHRKAPAVKGKRTRRATDRSLHLIARRAPDRRR